MRFTSWKQAPFCLAACLCAAISFHSLPALADSKPSVDSFFADPAIYDVVLSPKGGHVAMLIKNADGTQLIVVRDTDNLKSGTIVAGADKGDKIVAVHWVNEDRLTFTARAAINDVYAGNQDEIAVNRDGSHLIHLIAGNWQHTQSSTGSNIKSRILTADYAFFSTLNDGSDDIVVQKYFWRDSRPEHPEGTHLYRLNTRTQDIHDLIPGKSPAAAMDWTLDEHDVARIAESTIDGRCIVSYRASASDEWEEISNKGCFEGRIDPLAFDGDDTLIVRYGYKGYRALYRYDLKTRKLDDKPLLSLDGYDFSGQIYVNNRLNKMVGIYYQSDAHSTVWFDAQYKQLQSQIDAMLPQTVNQLSCGADCYSSPSVLVTSRSDRQPTQFSVYNVAKKELLGLGSSYPDIKPAQMGMRDFYRYQARDGMSIPIYVTMPPGKPAKPLPTVVLVHGGPWLRVWSWEWEAQAQFLASRGFMVLQPEFRGSTGFGSKLYRAGWKQFGQTMQDDLADAALWAVREKGADPKRIGIMGASYGGYATLMGLIKNPEIFRCGVEWAGVTDTGLMFSLAESDASEEVYYDWSVMIGDPKADADMFRKYSPLENAARLTQPLLIAHGADDARVPIAQATAFHDAVKKTNSNVEWVVYNSEGHGWHLEKDQLDFWKRVETFLDKNLMHAD